MYSVAATTALYAGLSGIALVLLSVRVIRLRRRLRVAVGHAGDPELERAIRLQGNFTEYTPLFLVLLFLSEMQGAPPAAVHAAGICFLIARLAHFLGFRSAASPGLLRVAGMGLTFAPIILLALHLVHGAF